MKILSIDINFKNPYYRYASGYSFFFFITWSLWWSLYAIWLKNTIGLTGAQLGILYSLNQFTSILFMVIYGIVQDKLGLKKNIMWLVSFTLVLTGPFLIYFYEPYLKDNFYPVVTIGSLFFGLGYLAGCGLVDSFIEKMSRSFRFEFGTARLWGSLGYAIGAFVAGIMFSINPHINFWAVSVMGLCFLAINTLFNETKSQGYIPERTDKPTKEDFFGLIKDKNFWIFVIFIIGTWSFYTIYDQQMFPVFYAGLFSTPELGTQVYGYLNAAQVVLEAICMGLAPFVVNKIGPKKALVIGATIMLARILLAAIFTDPYIISFVKMFHALEVPLFIIAIFKYAVTNFDKRLSSTIFLIGFQIASSIGIILLSMPLGELFDRVGYQSIFYMISAVVSIMVIFGAFMLSGKMQRLP
ncbi:oligosaccharide MFS transporter [Klebsiella sp. BIGb0407]|uniref:oligosaccharide MFS transporter n=1 Tax=Klebsiella sp. BIGb0407 TaxID=2940603 RepID=UPI0021689DA9|nr:oligosaccharide MFS transporter [Klebsiella sp. BIGb0407]MCS3431956.1 OHS family lactose permease-like MFS transporter [Klebsiella sp. BIGb0407]